MIDIYLHVHPITFEDCGVLGGRTAFQEGVEIHSKNGKPSSDFIEDVLRVLVRKSRHGKLVYPFKRIAVCFIDFNGAVSIAYTGDNDIENNTYSYISNDGNTGKVFYYYDIGQIFRQRSIQLYAIFQQQEDDTYRVVGNKIHNERFYVDAPDREEAFVSRELKGFNEGFSGGKDPFFSGTYNKPSSGDFNPGFGQVSRDNVSGETRMGTPVIEPEGETLDDGGVQVNGKDRREVCGYIYDVLRCLDLRGYCRTRVVEASDFRNYIKYDMGQDFYIEAYDNLNTDSREYWVGREYTRDKMLLDCFSLDDPEKDEVIDADWKIMIDDRLAEILCNLTDKNEYLLIDNDYRLRMYGLNLVK